MASLLQAFIDPKKNWFARQHMKAISQRLRKYGLRYDDLYDPYYDVDIKEALNRLPKEVVDARHARLKRAIDLSMKHEYLPEDLQALQTPFRSYLQEMLTFVKRERAERESLGDSYNRNVQEEIATTDQEDPAVYHSPEQSDESDDDLRKWSQYQSIIYGLLVSAEI
ncbi:Cytochrome bd ubiquinol oxidase, 14kDa subunit [Trifolium repens]|nr:Cytochrome bd ubiquinol oxidase, 14kDa subunit [Trifolium repens]